MVSSLQPKCMSPHACPPQPPRDTLPPTLGSREVSGAACVSLAARPGTRCPGRLSPWRSRSRRCGPQAGRGNSASPDAWGGEKSAYLQHRFKTFNIIKRDTAFSFPLNHCTCSKSPKELLLETLRGLGVCSSPSLTWKPNGFLTPHPKMDQELSGGSWVSSGTRVSECREAAWLCVPQKAPFAGLHHQQPPAEFSPFTWAALQFCEL